MVDNNNKPLYIRELEQEILTLTPEQIKKVLDFVRALKKERPHTSSSDQES